MANGSYSGVLFRSWCVAAALALPVVAWAQTGPVHVSEENNVTSGEDAPEWMRRLAIDPESPAAKKHADQVKTRKAAEKELRKLRFKHFRQTNSTPVRQEGLLKLREYTDPALFPLMIKLFEKDHPEVRLAVLDIFRDSQSDEGDTALAWVAVQDPESGMRSAAMERLNARLVKDKAPPLQIKLVVYEGLRSGKDTAMAAAAQLARGLNLVEVIPWLINAQVTGVPQGQVVGSGATGTPDAALAWIMVGTQTAFVSDLTPVVGPYAVAFDPQLSVVNTGVILRIIDAAVVAYHTDIHQILTDWTAEEMGQPMPPLGYNIPAWREWYKKEFVPHLTAKAEREALAAAPK